MVSRDVLEDTAIGAGESATRSRSVGINKSTQRPIHRRTRCKETFVNGRTQQRKGKVTTCPKVKVKAIVKGKRKHPGKGNRNQDEAGSPDEETGQRRLDDFGMKRQRVELSCVLRSKVQESHDGFDGIAKFVNESFFRSAGEWRAGQPHEKTDQERCFFAVGCRDERPTVDSGSVVSTCPVDYATSVPTEQVHYSMNMKSVLGESLQHYGIKRDVPFTNRICSQF